jgi:hypothetical protein
MKLPKRTNWKDCQMNDSQKEKYMKEIKFLLK